MTVKELKAMNDVQLIAEFFYMGVLLANSKRIKKHEKKLQMLCRECEARGFIVFADNLYKELCK